VVVKTLKFKSYSYNSYTLACMPCISSILLVLADEVLVSTYALQCNYDYVGSPTLEGQHLFIFH